ncbi:MAG: ATP-binding protein [Halovenus sp.]
MLAGPHLEEVLTQLVRNAVEHDRSDEPHVSVTTETSREGVTVSVRDDGPGLPERQQTLLETGRIAEFDDPTTGFGLNIVRLLAESFGASVGTTVDTDGTAVSLELTRTDAAGGSRAREHGVPRSRLGLAVGAGLLAGVAMAATMQAFEGLVGVVGALYGIRDPLVGVVTHEFHSVVFALGYAGLLSVLPVEYSERPVRRLGTAVAVSITLWAVAAGVVMPLWLEFVSSGVALPVPNLTLVSLLGHVSWGLTVGAVYYVGEWWLLSRAQERSGRPAVTT